MSNFSNEFKKLREKSGLTQAQMAEALKLSRSTVGMYEQGKREPDFETLEKIADYFNVKISTLIGDTGEEEHYYIDDEAREIAQFLFENPDYKILFDASRTVKKEDIQFVKDMIDKLNGR